MTKHSTVRKLLGFTALALVAMAFMITKNFWVADVIPLPFGYTSSSFLRGQATTIGNIGGFNVVRITFPLGTDSETLSEDTVYLVVSPNEAAVSTKPLDHILTVAGVRSGDFFGYEYLTSNASEEKAHRNDTEFLAQWPGKFLVSGEARANDALHGNAIAEFEAEHGITMSPTDGTPGSALLKPNSLYFIIVNETTPATFTARLPAVCSDDWVDTRGADGIAGNSDDEECDDSDTDNGDGCSSSCKIEEGYSCSGNPSECSPSPICGNIIVESPEQCDDGNTTNTDSCTNACREASCGDTYRYVAGGEECDDGNTTNRDGCSSVCTNEPLGSICGDGTIISPEVCDDADTTSGDGCSSTCQVEDGYQCLGEPSVCSVIPVCGNMVVEYPEVCDDGNTVNTDSCTNICQAPDCGDGYLQTQNNEQCDDGNTIETDDCDNSCQLTTPIPNI